VNDILKQRLVGALILVALGVIFWPIIFVDPQPDGSIEDLRIPPRPQVDTTPIAAPDPAGMRPSPELEGALEAETDAVEGGDTMDWTAPVAEVGAEIEVADPGGPPAEPQTAEPTALPAPGETRDEAPEQPELDGQGVPIAWMLQVASVSSQDKAEALRQRLEAMGEKAWVDPVNVGGRTMYRVNVGPKFERARLDNLRPQVDAEFGVKSLVRRYLP
tara:strand:+ start:43883 stop:44533 length:651 start_codon:yes stop_codon:yes gene_type:complete